MTQLRYEDRNIILTGFMGTGKTTVAHHLAFLLERPMIDTDELIEHWAKKSIPDIFAEEGESAFRAWELKVATYLAGKKRLVVPTGGGFVTNPRCIELVEKSGEVICLSAEPDIIFARTVNTDRPLLQVADPVAKIADLLAQRADIYGQFRQVETTNKMPRRIAYEILKLIGFEAK